MLDIISWLGAFLLAICGLPELIRTVRTGKCHIGWGMLLSWFFGEVLILIPVLHNNLGLFLVFNYLFNIIILMFLIFYKVKDLAIK